MKRSFRLLMVLGFALLQCMSPLAHAHVGGGHQGERIHLNGVQQQLDHAAALANQHEIAESQELPVVDMPQGKKRSVAESAFERAFEPLFLSSRIPGLATPQIFRAPRTITYQSADERPVPASLFRKQHPQAPPVFTL